MLFKTLFRSQIGGKMSKPVEVGSLKVGGYMVIDDQPCKIVSITKSKPGKHGAAKARIVAIGTFDGVKRSIVKPVDANTDVPLVDKRVGQVFTLNPNSVQIMDLETYEYLDATYPDDESIKDKLEVGTEIEYWKILGRIKIVRAK